MNNAVRQTPIVGAEDLSFLDQYAGQGLDTIGSNESATAYLGLVQPDSSLIDDNNQPGTWRNSATGENYGNVVRVVPVAFRTIWNERASEAPFATVGRYEPHSIKVDIKMPPAGKRGYPKMINPSTGNEVQELYIYAVMLPDYPEAGVLYFNPTVGSMRTCKSWNSQLKSQILPNGVQAPIFGYSWNLVAGLEQNPKQPAKQVARFIKVEKDSICSKDFFTSGVQPVLATVNQQVLAITAESEAEDEE